MIKGVAFKGTTNIYAVSDTHQETRRAAAFLSKMLEEQSKPKSGLFLHCGDYYEGIYSSELEADCYVKAKKKNQNIEMVMTIGNHDLGYDLKGYKYLLDTIRKFKDNGIKVVCSNIIDENGQIPEGVEPYTIVERDGDKIFITGFCTRFLGKQGQKFVKVINQEDKIDDLAQMIKNENPDNVIILNHDFMEFSQKIVNEMRKRGINVDLIIGGHDHRIVEADVLNNIYYPYSYSRSMYCGDLTNNKGEKALKNIREIKYDDKSLSVSEIFLPDIEAFEKRERLFEPIAKRVLDLNFAYSAPCVYGSFFADSIKDAANADIGFVSSGFIKSPLPYKKDSKITKYDLLQSMPTKTPVQIVELNAEELKAVFTHALAIMGDAKAGGNPRFLQCSSNIKIEGKRNFEKKSFDIKQISINDEPILDKSGKPISNRKYKCAIDTFIADGGQQFYILKEKEKKPLYINGKLSQINEVLKSAIERAPYEYKDEYSYPIMKIIED